MPKMIGIVKKKFVKKQRLKFVTIIIIFQLKYFQMLKSTVIP